MPEMRLNAVRAVARMAELVDSHRPRDYSAPGWLERSMENPWNMLANDLAGFAYSKKTSPTDAIEIRYAFTADDSV